MNDTRIYLFRFVIEFPEGVGHFGFFGKHLFDDIDDVPDWARSEVVRSLAKEGVEAPTAFQWPEGIVMSVPSYRRAMLHQTSAMRRAEVWRRFGAKVEVLRSLPVEWPDA